MKILIYGDSIMEGFSSEVLGEFYPWEECWPQLLKPKYGIDIVMMQKSGRSMIDEGEFKLFTDFVDQQDPSTFDAAIFALGTNDVQKKGETATSVIAHINQHLNYLKQKGFKHVIYMNHCSLIWERRNVYMWGVPVEKSFSSGSTRFRHPELTSDRTKAFYLEKTAFTTNRNSSRAWRKSS